MFLFNSTDACSSFITSHDLSACNNGSRDGSSDSVSPQLDPFATSSMDPRFGFSSLDGDDQGLWSSMRFTKY